MPNESKVNGGTWTDLVDIELIFLCSASDYTGVDTSWCLLESQDWVGRDVIRPGCTTDASDPSCADPANVTPEDERLANLYGDDVMMYQRLTSPYLPDHDYSDYLIQQYQDILDVCNATNNKPELVIRIPPDYPAAIPPPLNISSPTDTICVGQTIVKSTLDPNANCNSIAQAFNVATGDVQAASGNANCAISTPSICLPAPCALHQTTAGVTCESLATSFSTADLNVTTVQFLTWNPNINGLCDSLTVGDYVCASAPGGSYSPPPPPPGSVNANGQQRGGNDGSNAGNPDNTTTPAMTSAGSSPTATPSPIQSGIITGCTKFIKAQSGDYCSKFAQDNNITPDQLYTWNAVLGSGGNNCDTQFFLGYYYCVAAPSSSPPSPTQPGIAANCNKYQVAKSGDDCSGFALNNNMSINDLYAWNTVLGSGGSNCNTQLFVGYYYCIGISA
ncbi:MAG: hypothetical protein Q9188_002471 [Gyalolechia gomerana]